MLFVGVDWAETQHAVCMLDQQGRVVQRLTIPQTPGGVAQLRAAITAAEAEPGAVLVAIERPDGLLVAALLAAGYRLYALNPKAVERYRERTRVAGGKTDPADAELLARVLLTDRERHRPLDPSSPVAEELRVLARQDARASRDQRRLLNRLRQDLLAVSPALLAAFPTLGAVSPLAFLDRWPTATAARSLTLVEIAAFLRQHHHNHPDVAAARIHAALQAPALTAPPHLVVARTGAIELAVRQRLLLHRQRAAWEKRLRELLAGDDAHPDGEILLSLPGLDARLAARVLGEIGDRRERFPTPAALQCYAGTAPVTTASGRSRQVVARTACNRFLRQALLGWACRSLPRSAWARSVYDRLRAAGKAHFAALRILANRWLEILHHRLTPTTLRRGHPTLRRGHPAAQPCPGCRPGRRLSPRLAPNDARPLSCAPSAALAPRAQRGCTYHHEEQGVD